MRHVLIIAIAVGCGKTPNGDWEKTRDAYCQELQRVREHVVRELDIVHRNVGRTNLDAPTVDPMSREAQCGWRVGEVNAVAWMLGGVRRAAAAIEKGRTDANPRIDELDELGLLKKALEMQDACRNGKIPAATAVITDIKTSALAQVDRALGACKPGP